MKKILSVLLMASTVALAGPALPPASSIVGINGTTTEAIQNPIAGIPFSSLANASIYVLCGGRSGTSVGNTYFGLYSANAPQPGQTQFLIPAGKTLYGISASMLSSAENIWVLNTSTGTIPADNATTAPPGAMYFGSVLAGGNTGASPFFNVTASVAKTVSAVGVNLWGGNQNGLYVGLFQESAGHHYFCFTGYLQ